MKPFTINRKLVTGHPVRTLRWPAHRSSCGQWYTNRAWVLRASNVALEIPESLLDPGTPDAATLVEGMDFSQHVRVEFTGIIIISGDRGRSRIYSAPDGTFPVALDDHYAPLYEHVSVFGGGPKLPCALGTTLKTELLGVIAPSFPWAPDHASDALRTLIQELKR